MEDTKSKRVVAYVPFKTFMSAIESLEHGIPRRIDTSVWPTYSGAIRNQLLGAFRFLGLVDDFNRPTSTLKGLVEDKANRKAVLRRILETSYERIVSLDLTKLSPKQFDGAIREYGMTGETHRKVVSFFVQAAKYAALPMHPLLGKKTRLVAPRRGKGNDAARSVGPSTRVIATPSGIPSQGTSKTISLRSGGSLTLRVEGNFLDMGTDDRHFVFGLIDKLQQYERQKVTSRE